MAQLTIKLERSCEADRCGLCGKRIHAGSGPQLWVGDGPEGPVCRECGRQHAPPLAALLDLARVAERVGRIGRHTLVPPLAALLDLARAAEDYNETGPTRNRVAA